MTTYDLVLISKHIIAIESLDSPYKMIAADANKSGSVTTFDIVLGRKLILGIDTELACGSWKFVPQGSPVAANGSCVEFMGVKLGDITGPYFAPPPSERAAFVLHASDRILKAGETFTLQLETAEAISLQSLQMDLEIEPNTLKINRVSSSQLAGFDGTCYNPSVLQNGHLPILWIDGNKAEVHPDQAVLSLEMTALQDGKLSDMLRLHAGGLPSELFDENARPVQINLQWQAPETRETNAALLYPNPARNAFSVNFNSPEDLNARLQVIDIQGNVVLEQPAFIIKGQNRLQVNLENITPGLHAVKLNGRSLGCILLGI